MRYTALGGIAVTAAHLANILPEKPHPLHHALSWRDHLRTSSSRTLSRCGPDSCHLFSVW